MVFHRLVSDPLKDTWKNSSCYQTCVILKYLYLCPHQWAPSLMWSACWEGQFSLTFTSTEIHSVYHIKIVIFHVWLLPSFLQDEMGKKSKWNKKLFFQLLHNYWTTYISFKSLAVIFYDLISAIVIQLALKYMIHFWASLRSAWLPN